MSKIMVVDDEVKECELLERFLGRKGYDVITFYNGEKALEQIRYEKPDVILLDIKMAGMDGIEVLRNIREFDKDVGVIMVTALNDEATGIAATRLGANDYITKPVDLEHLETSIRKIWTDLLP
ncbi:MAG: response regulator [Candidatus Brocadiales bacterium]|nr:response regulator [Candidatus Brocadiales bacterium]